MKKVNWISCLLLMGGFLYFGSVSAVVLSFSPSSETVFVGENFDVDVIISDLYATDGSREIVSAFDLDVVYDASIISATGVTFGSSLGLNPSTDFFDLAADAWITSVLSAGRIDFAESSWLSNSELLALQPSDNFTLATLSFDSLAEGVSSLVFDPVTIPGVDVKGLDPFIPFDLSNTTQEGSITVVARVPEPGTLLLMLGGLIGMLNRRCLFRV